MRIRKEWIFVAIMWILAAALTVSGFMLVRRQLQIRTNEKILAMVREAVTVLPTANSVTHTELEGIAEQTIAEPAETEPEKTEPTVGETTGEQLEKPPIKVDFDYLLNINPDVKGWLYCAGTDISYALVQSSDNSYYLSHLVDGSRGPSGSIFLDYRCSEDFSDLNTIIYGHNMQNGSMFGGVDYFSDQTYYEEHSVMYLLTPEHNYRLDAVCGYIHAIDLPLYDLPADEADLDYSIWTGIARSTFVSPITPEKGDRFVTLSTCAYDFEGARYALMLKMTEIGS